MIPLVLRNLRGLVRDSRTLLLLTVVGVGLGVGSVVAIQTLNQGALQAFNGSVQAVSGQADLTVLGSTPTIPADLLPRILADKDVAAAWPLCRVDAALTDGSQELLQIVGFDVFAPVRYPLQRQLEDGETVSTRELVAAAMAVPGWAAVTPEFAHLHHLVPGDSLTVSSGSRLVHLVIGALVDFRKYEPLAPVNLAVMDIAQVQALLTRPDSVHQIDIVLRPGADPAEVAARLDRTLGPSFRIRTPQQRDQDASDLLAAFRLNLTALSLISVFVGLFLVTTSVQASLVRRRREFGVLRSLGMPSRKVLVLILTEAGVLGLCGVLVGIPAGYRIALANLESVSGTLTSIYVLEGISKLVLPVRVMLLGAGVGILGALLGSFLPARDMAGRAVTDLLSPLTIHRATGRRAGLLAAAAITLAAAGTYWYLVPGQGNKYGGFMLGLVMLICLPLLVPLVIRTVGRRLRPGGMGMALALRNLTVRLTASSFAVAALAVTISMMIGVTLLIGGFRQTLVTWLEVTIRADIYVTTESWVRAGNEAFLDHELLADLASLPEVTAVETQRRLQVHTADGRFRVWFSGISFASKRQLPLASRLPLYRGDPDTVASRLRHEAVVVIGEPLARKAHLDIGDTLVLASARGTVRLPIAGVAYDYTSEGGTAFTTLRTFARFFPADEPNNAALFLSPGTDPQAMVDRLKERYRGRPLVLRSNAELKRRVLDIFDQTFAVTRTLQTLALLIAVCGLALTLLIQTRERAGEIALLRAIGATRRQVGGLFMREGLAMALCGTVMGLVGGAGLAALLILVINRDWFGWTIRPYLPAREIALQIVVILAASVLAGLYPAWRSGQISTSQLDRDDL